jgi:dipeptidyl-peptidase-4
MKRLSLFTLLFALTFSIGTNAQSTDLLTLEQLIPGGNDYRNYVPRIPVNYLWSGNSLIETENDSVWIYRNPAKLREKSFLFSYVNCSIYKYLLINDLIHFKNYISSF